MKHFIAYVFLATGAFGLGMVLISRIWRSSTRAYDAAYEYGNINGTLARRHRRTGVCQMLLWKAGERGHTEDYWHPFGAGHEQYFIPDDRQDPTSSIDNEMKG